MLTNVVKIRTTIMAFPDQTYENLHTETPRAPTCHALRTYALAPSCTILLGPQADFILLWTSRYLTVAQHKQKLTTDLS